jgi:hypothetical protein
MKPSIVVAVVLALGIYFAPRREGQNSANRNADKAASQARQPAPLPVPYQINNYWVQAEAKLGEPQPPPWYESPEWALVVVGCITFIVIGWQSWETRRAATASKEAAMAAVLSAQSVIDTERPWFVASIERRGEDSDDWRVRITNKGRTPGHLAHLSAEHHLVADPE